MNRWMAAMAVGGIIVSGGMAEDRQGDPPQMTEADTMAKFTRVDKSLEYKHMDFSKFKEDQAQCQRWAALFPQALELARKDWDAAGTHAGRPFPASSLSPCKMELVDRLGSSDRLKPTRPGKNGGVYISKETAEHTYNMPKKWEDLLNKNYEAKKPMTDAEKQKSSDLKEAAELVMGETQMLEDKEKAGNASTDKKSGPKADNANPAKGLAPKP